MNDRFKTKRHHLNINADGILNLIDDIISAIETGNTEVLRQTKQRLDEQIIHLLKEQE